MKTTPEKRRDISNLLYPDAVSLLAGKTSDNTVIISIIGLILSVALGLFIAKSLTKPLDQILDVTEHIAGGDMTVQVPESDDEIGKS
ncbi:MAG: HAMP domain-containing protein [Methanolobus sp.]